MRPSPEDAPLAEKLEWAFDRASSLTSMVMAVTGTLLMLVVTIRAAIEGAWLAAAVAAACALIAACIARLWYRRARW